MRMRENISLLPTSTKTDMHSWETTHAGNATDKHACIIISHY